MDLNVEILDSAIEKLTEHYEKTKAELHEQLSNCEHSEGGLASGPSRLVADFNFVQEKQLDSSWLKELHPDVIKVLTSISLSKDDRSSEEVPTRLDENLELLKYNKKRFEEMQSWKGPLTENRLSPAEQKKKADKKRDEEIAKTEAKLQAYQSQFSYVVSEVCGAPPPGFMKFNTLLKELLTPHFTKGVNPWMEVKPDWYQGFLATLESVGFLKRSDDGGSVMLLDLTDGYGVE